MIRNCKVDITRNEFKSIFQKWVREVGIGKSNKIQYSNYCTIRDFFRHGECKVCNKNSNMYSITSSGMHSIVTSDECGCTFKIPSSRVSDMIEEYCEKEIETKKIKEESDRLSAVLAAATPDIDRSGLKSGLLSSKPTPWEASGVTIKYTGGKKNMNINGMIKGMEFGFVKGDKFKLSPLGLAFKNSDNGYSVYDAKKSEMTDVTGMTFEMDNAVMAMPTSIKKIVENDIIMHSNAYVVVKEVKANSLVVVSPFSSEIKEVIPVKNMFGFNFYTKLTPLFDMSGAKADEENPFGSMMPMMLMSQMGGQAGNQMNPMMMLAMMNMSKKKDGEDKGEDNGFMSKEMMMMMALSGSNGAGNGTGGNDMMSAMMMMSMFK